MTGCQACRDHPFVPYTIAATERTAQADAARPAPSASAAGALPEAAPVVDPFVARVASTAPPQAVHWAVDGVTLDAPEGRVFVSAVVGDFDGDGAAEAFAIARPPEGNDPGEVLLYRGAPAAMTVAATYSPPPGLARDAECAAVDRLEIVGTGSALMELGAKCPHAKPGPPDRWLAVVDARGARVRLAATIEDPPGVASLTVDAAATDRDGDGRDDLELRVTLAGGDEPLEPGPSVAASVVWLDRPAGLSRDSGATEASFASLAAAAMVRAGRAKEAAGVPGYVAQVQALWRAICADGGAPRMMTVAGTGALTCGVARPLEELGLAEVRAFATAGDPLRAALALDRNERAPAARTPSRLAEAQRWIAQLSPPASARLLRAVAGVPESPPRARSLVGCARVRADRQAPGAYACRRHTRRPGFWATRRPREGRTGRRVSPPRMARSIGLRPTILVMARPCAPRSSSHREATTATSLSPYRLRWRGVAPARGALQRRCSQSRGARAVSKRLSAERSLSSHPTSRTPRSLQVGSTPRATRARPGHPDSKTVVVPTSLGFIVQGASRTRILRASELDGTYGEQHDCAVSNDTTHVACVRGGRAWVGTWDG